MHESKLLDSRRVFLRGMACGVAGLSVHSLFNVPGLFAEQFTLTAPQGEGPFYPDRLPLDTDNDLLTVNDGITPAIGEVTHLTGRLLDASGGPLRNAVVEIWQVDHNGVYLHTDSDSNGERDQNFQGVWTLSDGLHGANTISARSSRCLMGTERRTSILQSR